MLRSSLHSGLHMAALNNVLRNDRLQHYFTTGDIERVIRRLMAMEEFTAGRD